jgi:raffinose/stachyose/melibiose transport system substrate-binding protein
MFQHRVGIRRAGTRPGGSPGWRLAKPVIAVIGGLALTGLAACGAPGGGGAAATSAPTAVNTSVGSTPVTLSFFVDAGLSAYEEALAKAFHAQYPKISFTYNVEPDNDYNTVADRVISSPNPPDIVGVPDLITAVKDGLLTNLDTYATAYGWTSKIPASTLAAGRVDNGVIGTGPLYEGGGSAGPLVGVFYNKQLAAKVGITQPPATLAQLEADLAMAKSMGITPIVASNGDGLIGHLYSLLLGDYMGSTALNNLINHVPGATLNTAAAIQATTVLQQWIKAGYFNSDANAIQQEASYGEFAGGKGLFMVTGSWAVPVLTPMFTGKYGLFPFPPLTADGKYTAMTSNSLAFSIPAHSAHKDAAALFLNFLTTPAAAQIMISNGFASCSSCKTVTPSLAGTVNSQILSGYSLVAADDGFTNWLQNAGSNMTDAETAQLQLLFAGKTTPSAMVASLQSSLVSGS